MVLRLFKAYCCYHLDGGGGRCYLSSNRYSQSVWHDRYEVRWQEIPSYINLNTFNCISITENLITASNYCGDGGQYFQFAILKEGDPELYEEVKEIIEGPLFLRN